MKKEFLNLVFALIAGVFLTMWFFTQSKLSKCKTSLAICPDTIIRIIETDTIFKIIYKPIPKPYKVVIFDSFPRIIDTAAILNEYYTKYLAVNFYSDTISDSNLIAIVDEVICENEMKSRGFQYKLMNGAQQVIVNPTPIYYSNGFYGGLISNYSDQKIGLGITAGYLTKKGYYFGAEYDVVHNIPGIYLMKKIK
jgi:hypothetical protein